jgi:DNA-binding protein HU-beta
LKKNVVEIAQYQKCIYLCRRFKARNKFFTILSVFIKIIIIMNKTDFVGAVAKNAGLSKVSAKKAVGAFIQEVEKTLKKGEKVALLGFGSFSVVKKAERKGVNPKTNESITIPPRNVVKFKPGAELNKAIK